MVEEEPRKIQQHEKIKLKEINSYLTCYLCKGYLIDATTISECLHSFCRSCIIKFLEEEDNSYCPICEVIINKAKPNLKLDKTLQDIVYKLVPGLFVKEMLSRKQFYLNHPEALTKASPEQRGEDTERTIFNPQDMISLSIEYISDDSSPGAIFVNGIKPAISSTENLTDPLLKRYLQCPGMCRIDVIKKFVQNKYNVNSEKFHIDILYKRVPLPDHYTLIDIAYIYMWKRNEPMKFFYRITDINKVSERFDFFDAAKIQQYSTPVRQEIKRVRGPNIKNKNTPNKRISAKQILRDKIKNKLNSTTTDKISDDKNVEANLKNKENNNEISPSKENVINNKTKELKKVNDIKPSSEIVKDVKEPANIEKEKTISPPTTKANTCDTKTPNLVIKNDIITNITLNRTNNSEVITKINKTNNNILHQTVKNTNSNKQEAKNEKPNVIKINKRVEDEKLEFFKTIELTSRQIIEDLAKQQRLQPNVVLNKIPQSVLTKPEKKQSPKNGKRKNTSPVKKSPPVKKAKSEQKKLAPKIILQNKKTVVENGLSETSETKTASKETTDDNVNKSNLKMLFNNCKINIPSSLSITLKETMEENKKPLIQPVQNFIEILKLPENGSNPPKTPTETVASPKSSPTITTTAPKPTQVPILPSPVPEITPKVLSMCKDIRSQSFQKIFEEAVLKADETVKTPDVNPPNPNGKRNIIEIAQQLFKKNKSEEKSATTSANMHSSTLGLNYTVSINQPNDSKTFPPKEVSITIPQVGSSNGKIFNKPMHTSNGRITPLSSPNVTSTNNVPKNGTASPNNTPLNLSPRPSNEAKAKSIKGTPTSSRKTPSPSVRKPSPKPKSPVKIKPAPPVPVPLTSNQILEKYHIQNLAQLTASFNLNPHMQHAPVLQGALQQAMLLNQIEMQRQKWLSINQAPLLQYEKYLQSLNASKNHLLGNIKDN